MHFSQADHLYKLIIGDTVAQFRLYYRLTSLNEFSQYESKETVAALRCPACLHVGTTFSSAFNIARCSLQFEE
jgi:hypothetical protein